MNTKLTDALADQFKEADVSRVVVSRAEIEDLLVPYDSLPIVRWHKIVELAIQQKKLELLVDIAVELTGNASLRELFDEPKALPVTPPEPPRKRLPYPWLTPWVGREREMAALGDALRARRLVTLRGTGGVGKTRLAVETLLARDGEAPQESVFVALENVADKPEGFLAAVRDALGLTEVDAPDLNTLCRQLEGSDRLLLLDNFESVMTAAPSVQQLAATAGVRVIVTSQRVLELPGETIVELKPMVDDESYRLFVDLAQQKDATWQPDDDAAMRDVLVATDGLPYLIELIAAIAPKRQLKQLATELTAIRAKNPLAGRHASVQTCLEWALGHLPAEEREALPRLATFTGGFNAEAALKITATPLASLDVLIDASLLRFDHETGRYSMLKTTHQFVRERLRDDERPRLAAAHAQWFIKRLDQADDALRAKGGETQTAARRWIGAEYDNVQQAVEWAESAEPELFERAVQAYGIYLRQTYRFSEFARLNETLLKRLSIDEAPQAWARTQNNLGVAYRNLPTGDRSENLANAIACYEAVLRVWTERDFPADWAMTQNNLGVAYSDLPTGDLSENFAKAIACYEAALRVRTERDFPADWAMTQNNLGIVYSEMPAGDRSENLANAIACYEAALRVWTERDFPANWATTQNNLGIAYRNLPAGDRSENLANAISCYEAALRVWTERDFPADWATAQNNLGNAYSNLPTGDRSENFAKAIACYEAALRVWSERDFPEKWAVTQYNLGRAHEEMELDVPGQHRQQAIHCYQSAEHGYAAVGLTDDMENARRRAAALAEKA
jgi:predicted ATPase